MSLPNSQGGPMRWRRLSLCPQRQYQAADFASQNDYQPNEGAMSRAPRVPNSPPYQDPKPLLPPIHTLVHLPTRRPSSPPTTPSETSVPASPAKRASQEYHFNKISPDSNKRTKIDYLVGGSSEKSSSGRPSSPQRLARSPKQTLPPMKRIEQFHPNVESSVSFPGRQRSHHQVLPDFPPGLETTVDGSSSQFRYRSPEAPQARDLQSPYNYSRRSISSPWPLPAPQIPRDSRTIGASLPPPTECHLTERLPPSTDAFPNHSNGYMRDPYQNHRQDIFQNRYAPHNSGTFQDHYSYHSSASFQSMQNLGLRHGEGQVPYQQYAWAVPGVADNIIPRKRRGNLPREATQYFKRWFNEHISSPYPTEEEKVHFVNVSGLTMAQVGNWFINQRRRNPMTKEKRISANQHHNQSESDEDEEEEEEE